MTTSLREEVGQVVIHYLAQHDSSPIVDHDEDLFDTGRVNSLFAIQLIGFLESHFGIKVTVEDLDLANFATINRIVTFVVGKQNA